MTIGSGRSVVALLLVLVGCGSNTPSVNTTSSADVDRSAVSVESDRIAMLSPCQRDEGDEYFPPETFLPDVDEWHSLDKVVDRGRPSTDERNGEPSLLALRAQPGDVAAERRVSVLETSMSAIENAHREGSSVTIGIMNFDDGKGQETAVLAAAFADNDATITFLGNCQHQTIYEPLETLLGADRVADEVRRIPRMTEADFAAWVGEEVPVSDEIVILNPEEIDPAFLESLQFVSVTVSVRDQERHLDNTICAKSSEGWNDCIPFTGSPEALPIDAYVGTDGVLEFWILDQNANLAAPLEQIGSVVLDQSLRGKGDVELSLTVSLETRPSVDNVTTRLVESAG